MRPNYPDVQRRAREREFHRAILTVIGAALLVGVAVGFLVGNAIAPKNQWHCASEDEVVTIGARCVHVDTLTIRP